MRGLCVERQLWVHKVAEAQNALESHPPGRWMDGAGASLLHLCPLAHGTCPPTPSCQGAAITPS